MRLAVYKNTYCVSKINETPIYFESSSIIDKLQKHQNIEEEKNKNEKRKFGGCNNGNKSWRDT